MMLTGGIEAADGKSILTGLCGASRRLRLRPLSARGIGARPNLLIMLEIAIECRDAQIGSHPARIAQKCKRLAVLARAAVTDREHVSNETEMVSLE